MREKLITLAYLSRNVIRENGLEMGTEIDKILASSRKNNLARGLTGALLFSNNCFAQLLEGPSEAVDEMYRFIAADPRHRDLVLLHRDELERRSFPDWSMAFPKAEPQAEGGLDLDRELTTRVTAHDRTSGRRLALMLYDLMRARAEAAGDLTWASFD